MICPKCGLEQPDSTTECLRCGLIFSRYRPPSERPRLPAGREVHVRSPAGRALDFLVPPAGKGQMMAMLLLKALLLALIALWSLKFLASSIESNYVGRSFMHLVNLPFHEAGHIFFRPFGRVLHSLGGSLGQVIMPLICMLVLLVRTRDPFGASVALWWTGESILDTAPYINDARSMSLQLLGGNTGATAPYGFHDWNFVLSETGHLADARALAELAETAGKSIMVLALLWGLAVVARQAWGLRRTG